MSQGTSEPKTPWFEPTTTQGWWFRRWASSRVFAGVTDRHIDVARLVERLRFPVVTVGAEQVHGRSVAVIGRPQGPVTMVAGCDALLTSTPGVALLIRTADCLPVFMADPLRGVIGLAHAGWRGLACALPAQLLSTLYRTYRTQAGDIHVAIGPAIRACCYEVGPEFLERFGPFVQRSGGTYHCDLVAAATAQLVRSGVRPNRILDSRQCTACTPTTWYSLRRESQVAGRLTSLIVLRP